MNIKNIVGAYIDLLSKGDKLDSYFELFPELFEHYFTFWSDRDLKFAADVDVLLKSEKLVLDRLPEIEKRLGSNGFNIDNINVVLFVGQHVANGHAAFLNGTWWVWIPVETYTTELQVDVFVTHEIIHALHYAKYPELFFKTLDQKKLLGRQLLTEGVATYVSMKVADVSDQHALWADFLSDGEFKNWLDDYKNKETQILEIALNEWGNSAKGLFEANDPKNVLQFRAGYKLGFDIVKKIMLQIGGLQELINTDVNVLNKYFLHEIQERGEQMPPRS